jgi:hypothetical protein
MTEITLDVTQALKDTENSLRDFIAVVLRAKLGESWLENCGVSSERLEKWKERKVAEEKRQGSGAVEQRLIYYADFYDLGTILKKHWSGEFADALGDWKTMDVWLSELEKLRDPDAHRRELLPHQKHLILGIAGEIRTRLVRYRSKKETSEDYYPRIESVRDNFGNVYTYGDDNVFTETRLRVGDVIDFVITATDPFGESLQYTLVSVDVPWQDSNVISLRLTEEHVARRFQVMLAIRSNRQFHAIKGFNDYDDSVIFNYEVLPPK